MDFFDSKLHPMTFFPHRWPLGTVKTRPPDVQILFSRPLLKKNRDHRMGPIFVGNQRMPLFFGEISGFHLDNNALFGLLI